VLLLLLLLFFNTHGSKDRGVKNRN